MVTLIFKNLIHPHCSYSFSVIVPVTYAWKDELEKKAYNAISKALNQNPVAAQTQDIYKTEKEFDKMEDDQVTYC